MSTESIRKRLRLLAESGLPAPWVHWYVAHLTLALDVIEAAKDVADHYDRSGEHPPALRRFDAALDAFEAAP